MRFIFQALELKAGVALQGRGSAGDGRDRQADNKAFLSGSPNEHSSNLKFKCQCARALNRKLLHGFSIMN